MDWEKVLGYCCAKLGRMGEMQEGVYLVAENNYNTAKKVIEVLNQRSVSQIIVTLPILQFPLNKEQFE